MYEIGKIKGLDWWPGAVALDDALFLVQLTLCDPCPGHSLPVDGSPMLLTSCRACYAASLPVRSEDS